MFGLGLLAGGARFQNELRSVLVPVTEPECRTEERERESESGRGERRTLVAY
jgi:hypothetical protein